VAVSGKRGEPWISTQKPLRFQHGFSLDVVSDTKSSVKPLKKLTARTDTGYIPPEGEFSSAEAR
jgi:hypothetical protein